MSTFKLGFRQLPSEADKFYPLTKLMGVPKEIPISKVWKPGAVLNQEETNACVGFSCFQLQASEPVVLSSPSLEPLDIYDEARKNDEWDDNDDVDEGTSVRAGLNVLRRHGIIQNYFWAESADQVLEYILKYGPLVFGVDWYESMFSPDANGFVRPSGRVVGGHAFFGHAADWKEKSITFRNSWSETWGNGGDFKMKLSTIDALLKDGGVAAAVTEVKP